MEEMPKNYDPQTAEPELIERWMSAGCYQRSKGVGDCTVVIPPPNVTGILHMGHAMDDSIQDTYVRYAALRAGSWAPITPVSPRRPRWTRSSRVRASPA